MRGESIDSIHKEPVTRKAFTCHDVIISALFYPSFFRQDVDDPVVD